MYLSKYTHTHTYIQVLWSHAFNLSQLIPRRVSWYCAGMGDSPRVSHRVEERLKYQAGSLVRYFLH